jgi:flavin-dependent dehydrogenase
MVRSAKNDRGRLRLADGATVVVVGGGPAGSFFAIRALRRARSQGRRLDLIILEKNREVCFYQPLVACGSWEGCNYCAGGISPRLTDVLKQDDLVLPDDVVEGKATEITLHGDWKSIQLPIPEGREMLSVFRGSRPRQRPDRYSNLDSYLLSTAVEEGAKVITAEARGIRYAADGKPLIVYRAATDDEGVEQTIEADFVVIAAGVNRSPGMDVASDDLYRGLAEVLPGFRPPQVRRALITEMQADEELLAYMGGEVHFAQYGSKDLQIEMSSLMPKGGWITIVMIGKSVDRAEFTEYRKLAERFLQLPHMQRLFPGDAHVTPVCLCHPNMTVGAARNGYWDGIAVTGDTAVSRLYKDGLYSAHATGSALADCILDIGIDRGSLKAGYWSTVRSFDLDNRFGAVVFWVNRTIFSRPVLSRYVYQAVLTERKTKPKDKRRLANVLWRIASGDDSYRRIFVAMLHPASLWLIVVGGVLATLRNQATERFFGLDWSGFGRYPTGVPKEDVAEKRHQIVEVLGIEPFARPPHVERMYSIRIKADEAAILYQLGRFGESDREYLNLRLIRVHRVAGNPNEVGCVIRYDIPFLRMSFNLQLEQVVAPHYLLYRVIDGFAKDGILAFDIDRRTVGGSVLTIYVAFSFPKGGNPVTSLGWRIFGFLFPEFLHDVVWNHSLCRLKNLAEAEEAPRSDA